MAGVGFGKVLAEGQLPSAKGTLYTCPSDRVAYVSAFSLYNSNGTSETIRIYVKPGSTSRVIRAYTLTTLTHQDALGTSRLVLEGGDLIEGDTTTAAKVDFVIMGIEEA